jgi:hypothetical protein
MNNKNMAGLDRVVCRQELEHADAGNSGAEVSMCTIWFHSPLLLSQCVYVGRGGCCVCVTVCDGVCVCEGLVECVCVCVCV